MAEDVDYVMSTIPEEWRRHWCTAAECACGGCVQVGNRMIMAKSYAWDPEYIDESKIPEDVYKKYKVTFKEWSDWMDRTTQNNLDNKI